MRKASALIEFVPFGQTWRRIVFSCNNMINKFDRLPSICMIRRAQAASLTLPSRTSRITSSTSSVRSSLIASNRIRGRDLRWGRSQGDWEMWLLYRQTKRPRDCLPFGGPNLRSYPWRQPELPDSFYSMPILFHRSDVCFSLLRSSKNFGIEIRFCLHFLHLSVIPLFSLILHSWCSNTAAT